MNAYIQSVIDTVKRRDNAKPEYIQCVEEVFSSLSPVIEQHPEYVEDDILTRMVEPDRLITFRVAWVDDDGKTRINRGYRVQFNSSIGPYKGGLRFHPSVNSSIMYFLGFEQTFKNSLTGLPMGGAKGGSDFDPRGKSKGEVMRFCQAFMTELYRHIGPNVDVPAGDIGVGAREIGFLFGQYKRISDAFENGVITGKGLSYGGSLIRPEATGYGAIYYTCEVFKHQHDDIQGKTFVVSGFGNVAWGAIKKITQLGGKALTISGPDGYVYDPDGIATDEKINYLLEMRASGRDRVQDYADKFGAEFHPGEKPWGVKGDVIIRFNPTDGAFIQRLYNAFDTLDKKQDKYTDEVQKCGDRVEIFNIADRRDKEMREIIDGLFEEPVCDSIFGSMNLYAMADGLHVWTNFLLALMDETDSAFAREQKATNPRIQKYTAKYRR